MKIDYYSDELHALLLQIIGFYENRGVKMKAVLSKSRTRPLPEIRAVYSVLAVQKYKQRYSITQVLGQINCDHSNFWHFQKMISDLYKFDKVFCKLFDKIKSDVLPDMMEIEYLTMEDLH